MRLLFIAVPDSFYLPFEQFLVKKGYEVFICDSSEEVKAQMQTGSFDTYIIEPFTNNNLGAFIIKQLIEWRLLDRVILILPGLNSNEESSAKKIVGNNYISLTDSFAVAEDKIVQIISTQRQDLNFPLYLHKPTIQYIKSEIEKAKRGRTSLSFIYYRLKNTSLNNQDITAILQKINISVNYRLRISDDAFPFQKGILVLLFGTHAQDRYIIANAIQKRLRRTLKSINIDFNANFDLAEATYPDDGNSYKEIMLLLETTVSKSMGKESPNSSHFISELFGEPITHQNLFRQKRKLKEIELTEASTYLHTNYLAPTWFGTLLQLCNEDSTTPRIIEEFILNETNIGERLLQLSYGIINAFPKRYPFDKPTNSQSLKEGCLILGNEEFKNLISLCSLESSIFSGTTIDLSVLKEIIYSQMATTLELSKNFDFQNKTELLLCTFCQAIGYILIKRKNADKFFDVYEKQAGTGKSIGQLFLAEIGFTPSELTWMFLNNWGVEEPIIESAYCVRYENTPQLNPQLTALTHLSIVISNIISGLGNEQGLKLAKISYDELLLRNRTFKPDSLNYLSDNYDNWLQEYNFIFI